MWTMHEYINADNPSNDKDYGTVEMFGDEVIRMIVDSTKGRNPTCKVYRSEYGDIKLVKDLGDRRHCWKFTHHTPIAGRIDDVPFSITDTED